MNIIQIAGFLGADPETRFTPNGQKVTTLRVATRTRKGGKEDTIWYRVTLWGDAFDKILTFFSKGKAIVVVGELHKPEIFTNREGQPQVSLEVTGAMIQFPPSSRSQQEESAPLGLAVQPAIPASSDLETSQPTTDDDLPF